MRTSNYYRTISGLCMLGIAAFFVWITVVPFGFKAAPIVAAVMLGLLLATLRLGIQYPVDYWVFSAKSPPVTRIVLMILTALSIQVIVAAVLQVSEQLTWVSSRVLYLSVWAGTPLVFIASGFVGLPVRQASPKLKELSVVALFAILVALAVCALGAVQYDGARSTNSPLSLIIAILVKLSGATLEEMVFRVMLLTALVQASGSRIHALILSSALFALIHIPPALAGPIVALDWGALPEYANAFWPEMVWKLGFGFLLGALWLRTGSIVLISVVHAICNLGPALVGGLAGLMN